MRTPTESSSTRSLLLSLQNAAELIGISAPTVLEGALGRIDRRTCDARLANWGDRIVANAKVEVTTTGRKYIEPGATYLIMSNHQSLYDIPILYHALGGNMRMVTKGELFKVPIFGGALRASGFVRVDRSDRKQAITALDDAKAMLAAGVNLWIAPEGTRSRTGDLLPFKKGGFIMAVETPMVVLPVTLSGTRNILPANGYRSQYGAKVRVDVHPSIDPSSFQGSSKERRDKLMSAVRRAIQSGLTNAP